MDIRGCSNAALQQVNQFWSMLDDLSENDPAAYKTFIERQMRDGAEYYSPPKPHTCICTSVQEPRGGLLYVNVCTWKRVPAPTSYTQPIPVCGGRLETNTDEQGSYRIVDVAFSSEVLQKAEGDLQEKEKIYLLALSFVQQKHNLSLSQNFTVCKAKLKGSVQDIKNRLTLPQQLKSSTPNPPIEPAPSLLQQISSLNGGQTEDEPAIQLSVGNEKPRPGLIEVISSTESAQPQQPKHHLSVCTESEDSVKVLKLCVELPGVRSVSQCQLSLTQVDLLLEVEDKYYLHLQFPEAVNEETCHATFNKKKQILTVTVSVL